MIYLCLAIVLFAAWMNRLACAFYRESAAEIGRVRGEIARVEYENEIFK